MMLEIPRPDIELRPLAMKDSASFSQSRSTRDWQIASFPTASQAFSSRPALSHPNLDLRLHLLNELCLVAEKQKVSQSRAPRHTLPLSRIDRVSS